MGCVASKLEEEEEVVSICKERKRQLKLAVEKRQALAEAHCRYCQSLYAVAAAIKLFVARHASPASPFLITFPPHSPSACQPKEEGNKSNVVNNPMFIEERPSESTIEEANACESCDSSTTSSDSSEEEECTEEMVRQQQQEHEHQSYGYYYMQMPPQQAVVQESPGGDFGWDFFNPFDVMKPEVMNGYRRSLDDNLRVVREQEGIPELEEEGSIRENGNEQRVFVAAEEGKGGEGFDGGDLVKVRDGNNGDGSSVEQKRHSVMESPEKGRELLDALKDIEDHFIRAYDSGKDVSKMLEANKVYLQSGMEEMKENFNKPILALPWHRSTSFRPSCKSLVASSSRSTSTWTEYTNDLFDGCGGMNAGSHSSTLGRLYAWEKKLYEEVKAGDATRKLYEKKCSRLRSHDVRGEDELNMDKTRAAIKDLYARILVAVRSAESISNRIERLRDEELEPQIVELLKGLTRTWKIMLESHENQNKILSQVKTFECPSAGKFSNDSHRLATLQLEAELLNWRTCFTDYVTASRSYVACLHSWLTKFLVPEVEFYSRTRRVGQSSPSLPSQAPPGPPLLTICRKWLSSMEKLPEVHLSFALKGFAKDVRALWVQQGEEQKQKRKVESLGKMLDRRTVSFHRTETRLLETKLIEYNNGEENVNSVNPFEHLAERKDELDFLQKKVEMEREKHYNYVQETSRVTLSGFQTGFSSVFKALTEFSKASMNMYNDLVVTSCSQSNGKMESQPCVESSSQVEEREAR
ncbi:unnamed protein product [Linum tenue]|uniref:Uncharacterized protein n=1 Tax=Linum tenue TaxID=586396 RepID=A0AAV0JF19_9ROSI|nr:unnamed protein product [Linum tenue]